MRFFCLILILLSALGGMSQNQKMRLFGTYPKAEGCVLYLQSQSSIYVIDSVRVLDGKFEFDLTDVNPGEYSLFTENKDGVKENMLVYLIPGTETNLIITGEKDPRYSGYYLCCEVQGNPTQEMMMEINGLVNHRMKDIWKTDVYDKFLFDIIERNDMVTLFTLYKYSSIYGRKLSSEQCLKILAMLTPEMKQLKEGKFVVQRYSEMAKFLPGALVPDFTLKMEDGNELNLFDFVKGKKSVLIDFWASWCGPCRYEGKNVKAIYDEFHEKGFDVLGVSLDDNLLEWRQAINEEGSEWAQVSDLKGWKTPLRYLFGFDGIPFLILLDSNGKIIARDLRGKALYDKVVESLK